MQVFSVGYVIVHMCMGEVGIGRSFISKRGNFHFSLAEYLRGFFLFTTFGEIKRKTVKMSSHKVYEDGVVWLIDLISGHIIGNSSPLINRKLDLNKQQNLQKDKEETCWFNVKLQ